MFAGLDALVVLLIIILYQKYSDFIREGMLSFKGKITGKAKKASPVITREMIEEAMANRTYGDFTLTPAVVFFKDGDVAPSEGYKIDKWKIPDGRTQSRITISASAEKILDIYDDLAKQLGDTCGIVVEDYRVKQGHIDHFGYSKDLFVIRSVLVDFEEFILNDGFVGIAIWSDFTQAGVQLTVHKIIMIYAFEIRSFLRVLARYGLREDPELKFLFEDFHALIETAAGDSALEALKDRLCIDYSVVQAGDSSLMMN